MERQTIRIHDSETLVRGYLDALAQRDLSRCMEVYTDDATITLLHATFRGRTAIEKWHRERFAAELELVQLNQVRVKKDSVVVDAIVTSARLQSLKIGTLRGSGTFKMENGKIKDVSFRPKMYNPLENWGKQ